MDIFLASTTQGLRDIRDIIGDGIKKLGYNPILFENGGVHYSSENDIFKASLEKVKSSDIVVAIINEFNSSPIRNIQNLFSEADINKLKKLSKSIFLLKNNINNITITQAEILVAILNNIPIYL